MSIGPVTVRVIKIQQGNYPEWVRSAWLGCELPCIPGIEEVLPLTISVVPKDLRVVDADAAPETTEPEAHQITGFLVRRDTALTVLRKKLPAAALRYSDNHYLQPNSYFAFEVEDVEMVEQEALATMAPVATILKPRT